MPALEALQVVSWHRSAAVATRWSYGAAGCFRRYYGWTVVGVAVAVLIRPDGSYATSLMVLAIMSALAGLALLTATPPRQDS